MFYLADWIHTPDGFVPDFPPEVKWGYVAEPRRRGDRSAIIPALAAAGDEALTTPEFGVFEASNFYEDDIPSHSSIEAVPQYLSDSLSAAMQYAPALAIARDEVRKIAVASRADFVKVLHHRLIHYLGAQVTAPYFLTFPTQSVTVELSTFAYYWIVGYYPERLGGEVNWVSRDYHIYTESVDLFDVDPEWLAARFGVTNGE